MEVNGVKLTMRQYLKRKERSTVHGQAPDRDESAERARKRAMIEGRKASLKTSVENMSETEMKEFLLLAVDRRPGILFNIWQTRDGFGQDPPNPVEPNPSWCTCGHCRQMGSEKENLCCGMDPDNCVSQSSTIERYCLNDERVNLGKGIKEDLYCDEFYTDPDNRRMRHAAYAQFIFWRANRLNIGANPRVMIYSCCVCRIREKYPNPNGKYTGFER